MKGRRVREEGWERSGKEKQRRAVQSYPALKTDCSAFSRRERVLLALVEKRETNYEYRRVN